MADRLYTAYQISRAVGLAEYKKSDVQDLLQEIKSEQGNEGIGREIYGAFEHSGNYQVLTLGRVRARPRTSTVWVEPSAELCITENGLKDLARLQTGAEDGIIIKGERYQIDWAKLSEKVGDHSRVIDRENGKIPDSVAARIGGRTLDGDVKKYKPNEEPSR